MQKSYLSYVFFSSVFLGLTLNFSDLYAAKSLWKTNLARRDNASIIEPYILVREIRQNIFSYTESDTKASGQQLSKNPQVIVITKEDNKKPSYPPTYRWISLKDIFEKLDQEGDTTLRRNDFKNISVKSRGGDSTTIDNGVIRVLWTQRATLYPSTSSQAGAAQSTDSTTPKKSDKGAGSAGSSDAAINSQHPDQTTQDWIKKIEDWEVASGQFSRGEFKNFANGSHLDEALVKRLWCTHVHPKLKKEQWYQDLWFNDPHYKPGCP